MERSTACSSPSAGRKDESRGNGLIMTTTDLFKVLQQRPLGLVFDIDGTLSPIVPTPDEAQLYPGIAQSLEQLKSRAHVAIMTGRAVADGARIVNAEGLTYIGTHGLEWCDGLP